MRVPVEPSPSPMPVATGFEQTLLTGIPGTKQAELLPLLRSPDHVVHEVALLLIQLDREDAARQAARRATPQRRQGVAPRW